MKKNLLLFSITLLTIHNLYSLNLRVTNVNQLPAQMRAMPQNVQRQIASYPIASHPLKNWLLNKVGPGEKTTITDWFTTIAERGTFAPRFREGAQAARRNTFDPLLLYVILNQFYNAVSKAETQAARAVQARNERTRRTMIQEIQRGQRPISPAIINKNAIPETAEIALYLQLMPRVAQRLLRPYLATREFVTYPDQ